jgi:hypothetical protein
MRRVYLAKFTPPSVFGGARGSLNSGIDLLVGY